MSVVTLENYSEAWPACFSAIRAEIAAVFSPSTPAIEHIGSTSVPGLCAKPVIDVMLGVSSLQEVEERIGCLQDLGYVYRPEYELHLPERRYFSRKSAGNSLPVHVHAAVYDSPFWQRHLLFRDALRSDQALANEYACLKQSLAILHATDRLAYTEAKGPFILGVLSRLRCAEVGPGQE